jgi:hypothetical protein
MTDSVAELEIDVALLAGVSQRRSMYRPNHRHPLSGEFFLGHVTFHQGFVDPGTVARATIHLLLPQDQLASLLAFGYWPIFEAQTHVGSAKIVSITSAPDPPASV